MKELIKKGFNKTIDDTFKGKDELIKFFKNHERREIIFENLACELRKTELTYPLTRKQIDDIVKSMTHQFCRAALTVKEKDIISENAKYEMEKKLDDHLDIIEKLDTCDMAEEEEYIPPKKALNIT